MWRADRTPCTRGAWSAGCGFPAWAGGPVLRARRELGSGPGHTARCPPLAQRSLSLSPGSKASRLHSGHLTLRAAPWEEGQHGGDVSGSSVTPAGDAGDRVAERTAPGLSALRGSPRIHFCIHFSTCGAFPVPGK